MICGLQMHQALDSDTSYSLTYRRMCYIDIILSENSKLFDKIIRVDDLDIVKIVIIVGAKKNVVTPYVDSLAG